MRLPLGRMRRATSSVFCSSRPPSSTPATFGLRPMPASVLKATSRSWPYWPRTNSVVTAMVPSTAAQIARVTGLQLSMIEITATWLRTPTLPLARA